MIESGTKLYRTRIPMRDGKIMDCDYFTVYPLMMKFCLPGDIWRIKTDMLIRYQPMLAPVLTTAHARVRFGFVPLRLIEPNTELTITGSKDGHLFTGTLPEFETILHSSYQGFTTHKGDFCDLAFGMQPMDYSGHVDDKAMPAAYWYKAYVRFWWDFWRDENLWNSEALMSTYSDFTQFVNFMLANCLTQSPNWNSAAYQVHGGLLPVFLQKNYLTSALPWQLKGVAPVVPINGTFTLGSNPFSATTDNPLRYSGKLAGADISGTSGLWQTTTNYQATRGVPATDNPGQAVFDSNTSGDYANYYLNEAALNAMISGASINATGAGFNAADLRVMMAQTRIFERLARTGSRYTEYLRANFGTSPADGTLQRAQYLGGYKVPIITSEVLQTAEDGTTPVGTMRGHGVSRGGDRMHTFHCHEFGILIATIDFRPSIEWTQGVDRQFTYKSRFDFFNPSFQHLSEQEVRNGEIFLSNDAYNDDTFGFQAYGQELRMGRNMVVGDMRDSLAFWTQTTDFSARPNLNVSFLNGWSYRAAHHKPFAVTSGNPIILQFEARSDVYRPMVRFATPGLVDHL